MSRKQEAMSAVRANPKSSKAWSDLGDVLAAEGQLEKAKESYLRAIQLDPANAAAQEGMFNASIAQAQAEAPVEPPPQRATPSQNPPPFDREEPSPPSSSRGGAKAVDTPARETRERRDTAPQPAVTPSAPKSASGSSGGGKPAINLRKKPPEAQKPSQGRIIAGVVGAFVLPLLCLCALMVYALSLALSGGS